MLVTTVKTKTSFSKIWYVFTHRENKNFKFVFTSNTQNHLFEVIGLKVYVILIVSL